jgi:hypothetical protein
MCRSRSPIATPCKTRCGYYWEAEGQVFSGKPPRALERPDMKTENSYGLMATTFPFFDT